MDDTQKEKQVTEKAKGDAPVMKYRYFCDSCTGIAFTSAEKRNPNVVYCRNCGKAVGPDKEENYIPL